MDPNPAVVRREGEVAVVTLSGEIDIAAEHEVAGAFSAALAGRPSAVIVDLSGVSFMDCSGVSALTMLRVKGSRVGIQPVLTSVPASVARLLDLLGLSKVFTTAAGSSGPQPTVIMHAVPCREGPIPTPIA